MTPELLAEEAFFIENISDEQRKLAVQTARDVLKRIISRKKSIQVRRNYAYCEQDEGYVLDEHRGENLQKIMWDIFTPQTPCTVCARGALFLAYVDRHNKVKVPLAGHLNDIAQDTSILKDAFSENQQDFIEAAFENRTYFYKVNLSSLSRFYSKHNFEDARKLLRAVCKNIISNNGLFNPFRGFGRIE